ncbi:MAG TPA: bifunctional glutamate N-acetyltransferase/amino-acid acetyltransferase ArgJ [Candidatus Acidoferrales bacterium]|nr:bifunctional glutamate N-acetyltransferase/amino-acid acetyltransferase ArgJ [Candidatus Acidoferrales bacterium]
MRKSLPQSALPAGYRFGAMACGLKKKKKLDLGMISSDAPASAAAVFTTNLVQAAPVVFSREQLRASRGTLRGVVVNSGNANCSTGPDGLRASRSTAAQAAREIGCRPEEIFVCSTGVIGVPLRVERILRAIPPLAAAQRHSASFFAAFTRAIMTTDTRPKWAAARCRIGGKTVRLLGCCKGAGMIHPAMAPPSATMLAFVVTDAAIAPRLLQRLLAGIANRTFNAITVDGDTSTNDTLLVMANGASRCRAIQAGRPDLRRFSAALEEVCRSLALQIVADGEGATRVVEIAVRGGRSEPGALQIARTIATSSLVKTALAGGDPNWGRILAAAGRAGVPFDPGRVDIAMAGIPVYRRGRALPLDERAAHRKLLAKHVCIVMDLRQGRAAARYWTCDFTGDYVRINASYRT